MGSLPKIAFVGAGNMAGAIIHGLAASGAWPPSVLGAADIHAERLRSLSEEHQIRTFERNEDACGWADVIVLSVKPQVVDAVLPTLKPTLSEKKLLISICAGVSCAALEAGLESGRRVVRVMPNTPSLVAAGASALAAGSHASEDDLALTESIFQSIGSVKRVAEGLMDAVTGLSGSGPAFVFLAIEGLADGGVRAGLPRDVATSLAAQTVLGAAKLVLETGEHPGVLKDRVTSPAGTTIAGLHELEKAGVRGAFMDAVQAAAQRSREMGSG